MYSVVFVDDEPWSAIDAMASVDWSRHDLSVIAYLNDPVKALDDVQRLMPDLVIVDIRMPEMDGFEFIERCVARRGNQCLFVILSGFNDFDYAVRALRLPVEDYWLKPLDPALVDDALTKIRLKLGSAPQTSASPDHFDALLGYIRENAEGKLLLEDVAAAFNYNRNYLCTLFKRRTGQSFVQYLTDIRLRRGCQLLLTTDLGLDAIARQCGLGDAVYFNKVFRKHMRTTPAAYRRSRGKEQSS